MKSLQRWQRFSIPDISNGDLDLGTPTINGDLELGTPTGNGDLEFGTLTHERIRGILIFNNQCTYEVSSKSVMKWSRYVYSDDQDFL